MKIVSPRYRLAVYRGIALAADGKGIFTSVELAAITGINATQVRRDLSALGMLGRRGVGYRADVLVRQLEPHVQGAEGEIEQAASLAVFARRGLQ